MNQTTASGKIGKYRWVVCTLLFFAITIDYLDRQAIGYLKPVLDKEFGWTESNFSDIVIIATLAYALTNLFAGWFIDKVGTKKGYAASLATWSFFGIANAFGSTLPYFKVVRGLFGVGEGANFPAAIKTTAQWFPKKERALATGIFNAGSNFGAMLCSIFVPMIAYSALGWRGAFIITGAVGLLWLIFWFWFYDTPDKQKRLSKEEYDYIHQDEAADNAAIAAALEAAKAEAAARGEEHVAKKVTWFTLLKYRQTWAYVTGKFMTDGIWWFYLFWLPAYMKSQFGMEGNAISAPLFMLYGFAIVGSVSGGGFPTYFMNKGMEAYKARLTAMFIIACCPLFVLGTQYVSTYGYWFAVAAIGIGAAAHQAWSANLFTTVSDMFPKKKIASVTGLGTMAGGMGGLLVFKSAGLLFDHFRNKGIDAGWAKATALKDAHLSNYISQIRALSSSNGLLDRHKSVINVETIDIGRMSKEVIEHLQKIDASAFEQLKTIQHDTVGSQMTIAYGAMFGFCALAYLIAWTIMKVLVPKHKPITDL